MTTASPGEVAVRRALVEAGTWCSADDVWRRTDPPVKRRLVKHHLRRLVAAGEVEWATAIVPLPGAPTPWARAGEVYRLPAGVSPVVYDGS